MVLSRSTSASARSSSPRVGSSPLIQSTKCWVGRTLRAERLSSFMVVSSTSKRRPLWVLAAGFTNGSRAEPPTTELGSENSGRPALPGEWRRRRPGGVASVGASRQEPFGLHSPGKAQLPQNPGATQERPEATTLGAIGGRSAPLVRLETTGGRSALPGEWRRRRPGGVASVGACRQEPFGLHSPGKAQLPQSPGTLPTKTQRPSPQNPGAPHTRQPAGAASLHLRAHGREQQHIADRGAVGQQHHQAVDADALAGGGRQAIFERTHIVSVVVHRLVVAGLLLRHLLE